MKTNEIISKLKHARDNTYLPVLGGESYCALAPKIIDAAIERLESLEKERAACFRLGQMDMQESVVTMLKNAADNTFGISRSTLRDAAKAVSEMELTSG